MWGLTRIMESYDKQYLDSRRRFVWHERFWLSSKRSLRPSALFCMRLAVAQLGSMVRSTGICSTENGFLVNCKCGVSEDKHKYDLVCHNPISNMVAELKVYGLSGYYPKNLCGPFNIKRFVPKSAGDRLFVRQEEMEEMDRKLDELKNRDFNEWKKKNSEWKSSYLADILRLLLLPEKMERYMILVLQKSVNPDDFGNAIMAVQVSRSEWKWECSDFFVRVSRLYGMKACLI